MSDNLNPTSIEDFISILENLKLHATAKALKYEIESHEQLNKYEHTFSKNPFVLKLLQKLNKEETKSNTNTNNTNIVSNENKHPLLNSKLYTNVYNNFYSAKTIPNNDLINLQNHISSNKKGNSSFSSKNNVLSIHTNDQVINEPKQKFHYTETEMNDDSKIEESKSLNNNNNTTTKDKDEDDSMFNQLNTSSNNNNNNNSNSNNTVKKLNANSTKSKPFTGSYQLDKMLQLQKLKMEHYTNHHNNPNNSNNSNMMDSSSFFQNSQSLIYHEDNPHNQSDIDDYVDDDDPGFELYECARKCIDEISKNLSEQYGFPERAFYKSNFKDLVRPERERTQNMSSINDQHKLNLPKEVKFMASSDEYYPLITGNVCLDCFDMKIIIDREKVGFELDKELKFKENMLIAGRYRFIKELGDAAFSTAIQCHDIVEKRMVCIKVVKNNKDYFDQSIDEIKLLRYINANGDPDEKCFLRVYDYFYYKEHLMIVTELLKDNLYEFYKYINDNNIDYFTVPKIQKIAKQVLTCLEFIHKLRMIHCDLKPENILMKSISDVTCKVIDFGSSCFIHDHLSTYIISRSYRAPEVILGCKYDFKIDLWSLGCILVELYTGNVLFQNDSIQGLLARIMGICGPFPDWMFEKGKLVNDFFTKDKLLYMEPNEGNNETEVNDSNRLDTENGKKVHILVPKRSSLKKRLKTSDENFYNFVKRLLEIDPNIRMSATEALNHPWIKDVKYPENN